MNSRNLNQLLSADPSLKKGTFNLVYERVCPLELQIDDPGIREMAGGEISRHEEMQVKILARGKEQTLNIKHQLTAGIPLSARLENERQETPPGRTPKAELDHIDTAQFLENTSGGPFHQSPDPVMKACPRTLTLETYDGGEQNPEVIRIELTSDFDYFMQYVYE